VVHDDGTVSLQTIAEDSDDETIGTQKKHCAQMRILQERLKENWFISYDYDETEPPEKITTLSQWKSYSGFDGTDLETTTSSRRERKKQESETRRME